MSGGGPRPPRPSPESWESMEAPAENLSEDLSENPVTAATMDMGKARHRAKETSFSCLQKFI